MLQYMASTWKIFAIFLMMSFYMIIHMSVPLLILDSSVCYINDPADASCCILLLIIIIRKGGLQAVQI